MVEETEATTEATETLKPGEATAIDETVTPAEPGANFKGKRDAKHTQLPDMHTDDGQKLRSAVYVEVNSALLDDLPLPAFQRIIALPVGGHVAAVENTRRRLVFIRAAAEIYAAGVIAKTKATDVPAELKALAELGAEGRGGDVFSLADILEARRRVANVAREKVLN